MSETTLEASFRRSARTRRDRERRTLSQTNGVTLWCTKDDDGARFS